MFALATRWVVHDVDTFSATLWISPVCHKVSLTPSEHRRRCCFFIFAIFVYGKYLDKNFSTIWFHVVIEPLGREFNHYFAWFLRENGNSLSLIASFVAPLILNASCTSKKLAIWALGSSSCNPSNYTNWCTIWIIFNLTLKYWLQ